MANSLSASVVVFVVVFSVKRVRVSIYIAWLAFALFKGVFAFSRARQRRAETHTRFYHYYVCIIISVFRAATAMAAHRRIAF